MSDVLAATTGTWVIDPSHTRLGFSVRHAMVTTVRGQFDQFEGSLVLDGEDPGKSSATVTIQTASIATGSEDRDNHLRSPDFFDADQFPTMTFAATDVVAHNDEDFEMAGLLTLHGVTQPVTIKAEYQGLVTDPFGNERIGFAGQTQINRKDFGLSWNAALETGGVLVGDKVKITLDISAIKAPESA
jgi:polyisoprenoid-binding protein YceI